MPPVFRLLPSTRFKRDFEEIHKNNRDIVRKIEPLKTILLHDPYNRSRRYDIIGDDVILYSFKHRKGAY